jgi:hypothetical protein
VSRLEVMLGRSGYRALPLGDFDRFQQSSFGFLGSQKGCLSPEPGSVGPGAGEWLPSTADRGAPQDLYSLPLGGRRVKGIGYEVGARQGVGMLPPICSPYGTSCSFGSRAAPSSLILAHPVTISRIAHHA